VRLILEWRVHIAGAKPAPWQKEKAMPDTLVAEHVIDNRRKRAGHQLAAPVARVSAPRK
jgi:hypothetical protein